MNSPASKNVRCTVYILIFKVFLLVKTSEFVNDIISKFLCYFSVG